MIPLPPGCVVNYPIFIDVDAVSDEMCDWFELIGGKVLTSKWYDWKGREHTVKNVQYGLSKPCHRYQDGSGKVKLHFHGNDATIASMFLIKFNEHVEQHNMKDYTV